MNALYKKLLSVRTLKRIYFERLSEPIIYNLVSIFYFFFGSYRKKIEYDLVPRQAYAFGLDQAFDIAKSEKIKKIFLIEFGVGSGAGLFNMAHIAEKLSKIFDIDYEVIGFDTGEGLPHPEDWRDHPEKFKEGDFSPLVEITNLPKKTTIYYGDILTELPKFESDLKKQGGVIGFIALDVDYYSSTKKCFEIYSLPWKYFLSITPLCFDDIIDIDHSDYCGPLLAIKEFNEHPRFERKMAPMNRLRLSRIFKNPVWIEHMYYLHVFDHVFRQGYRGKEKGNVLLSNPYLCSSKGVG
jgi:hypothetical protein